MIARDIMTRKVYTISPEASVQEVAQLLSRKSISGVPVIDKDGKIIGIATEADIIGKVNREGLRVADIMSPEIIAVDEETVVGEKKEKNQQLSCPPPSWARVLVPCSI